MEELYTTLLHPTSSCVCVCVCTRTCVCSFASDSLGPMGSSLPDSSVHGIFKARILEWVAFPTPDNLPDSKIKPLSLMSLALAGRFFTTEPLGKLQRSPYFLPNLTNIEENELFEEFQQL